VKFSGSPHRSVRRIRALANIHQCLDAVRDSVRIEDVEKMDGDDAADAARYGLISRYAARRSWK
jgi:hypothetical protein